MGRWSRPQRWVGCFHRTEGRQPNHDQCIWWKGHRTCGQHRWGHHHSYRRNGHYEDRHLHNSSDGDAYVRSKWSQRCLDFCLLCLKFWFLTNGDRSEAKFDNRTSCGHRFKQDATKFRAPGQRRSSWWVHLSPAHACNAHPSGPQQPKLPDQDQRRGIQPRSARHAVTQFCSSIDGECQHGSC